MPTSSSCGFTRMFSLPLTEGYETSVCIKDPEGKYLKYADGIFYACHEEDETYVFVVAKDNPTQVLFQYFFQPNEPALMYASDFCAILEIPLFSVKGSIQNVLHQLESTAIREKADTHFERRPPPIAKVAFQFSEILHCLSICDFYLWAVRRDKSQENHKFIYEMSFVESLQGRQTVTEPAPLPPLPNLLNLQIVLNHFERCLYSPFTCTMLTMFITSTDYLSKLFEVFQKATDLDSPLQPSNLGNDRMTMLAAQRFGHESTNQFNPYERTQMLWTISEIVKAMIRTNRQELICALVAPENFPRVLMMLEYDRTFGAKKANYADFYTKSSRSKLTFSVTDGNLMNGIQMMFRLYLLRDIAVGWIHEPTDRFLSAFILKAHSNLVLGLTENRQFFDELNNLFGVEGFANSIDECRIFQDPSADAKENAFVFINEFLTSVRLLPTANCRNFLRMLLDSGVLMALMRYGLDVRRRKDIKIMCISSLKQILDSEPVKMHAHLQTIFQLLVTLISCHKDMDPQVLSSVLEFFPPVDQVQAQLDTRDNSGQADEHALLVETGAVMIKLISLYREEAIDTFFYTVWRINRLIGGELSLFLLPKNEASYSNGSKLQGSTLKVAQVATFFDVVCESIKLYTQRTITNMTRYAFWERIGQAFTTTRSILTGTSSDSSQTHSNQSLDSLDRKGKFQILTHILSLLRHAVNALVVLEGESGRVLQRQLIYSKLLKQVMHNACDNDIERGVQRASFLQIMTTIADMHNSQDLQDHVSLIVDYLKHKQLTLAQKTCEEYSVVKRIIYDPEDTSVSAFSLSDNHVLSGDGSSAQAMGRLNGSGFHSSSDSTEKDNLAKKSQTGLSAVSSPKEPCLASAWVPKKECGTQRDEILYREQLLAQSRKSEQKRMESLTLEHRRQQELKQRQVLLSAIRAHAAQRQRLHHHLFFEQHLQQQRKAEHHAKTQRDLKERQRQQQRGEHTREIEEARREREKERLLNMREIQPAYIRSLQPQRIPRKEENGLDSLIYGKLDGTLGDNMGRASPALEESENNSGLEYSGTGHHRPFSDYKDEYRSMERSLSPSEEPSETGVPIVPVDPAAPAVSVPMGQSRLARQAKHARARSYIPLPSVPDSPGLRKPFDEDDEPEPKRIRFAL